MKNIKESKLKALFVINHVRSLASCLDRLKGERKLIRDLAIMTTTAGNIQAYTGLMHEKDKVCEKVSCSELW
jgi:hypothetical protein